MEILIVNNCCAYNLVLVWEKTLVNSLLLAKASTPCFPSRPPPFWPWPNENSSAKTSALRSQRPILIKLIPSSTKKCSLVRFASSCSSRLFWDSAATPSAWPAPRISPATASHAECAIVTCPPTTYPTRWSSRGFCLVIWAGVSRRSKSSTEKENKLSKKSRKIAELEKWTWGNLLITGVTRNLPGRRELSLTSRKMAL